MDTRSLNSWDVFHKTFFDKDSFFVKETFFHSLTEKKNDKKQKTFLYKYFKDTHLNISVNRLEKAG